MIRINDTISIPDKDVEERFTRAMGPGGQNARRDETAVQLRYDVAASALPVEMKRRLLSLAGRHMSAEGVLLVESRAYRSQATNREAARDRLLALLRRAAREPPARRPTRLRGHDKEVRLAEKKLHAAAKQQRSRPREE